MQKRHFQIALSIYWKLLLLLIVIFAATFGVASWHFWHALEIEEDYYTQARKIEQTRLIDHALVDEKKSIEQIVLWVPLLFSSEQTAVRQFFEASLVNEDIVHMEVLKGLNKQVIYHEPGVPAFDNMAQAQKAKGLFCGKQSCYLSYQLQSYTLSGTPFKVWVVERAGKLFEQLRSLTSGTSRVLALMDTRTPGQPQVRLATDIQKASALWQHITAQTFEAAVNGLLKIDGHYYFVSPLQVSFSHVSGMQFWVFENVDAYVHMRKDAIKSMTVEMVLAWVFFLAFLMWRLKRRIDIVHQVQSAMEEAIQGRFRQATARLRWKKLPFFLDEFHKLKLNARRMLGRLGRMKNQLEWMAYHDTLTGMNNRRAFYRALQKVAEQGCGAIFFLDLNHFKQINDVYGHEVGDQVLKDFAEKVEGLQQQFHLKGYRLAGDEFVLLMSRAINPHEVVSMMPTLVNTLSGEVMTERGERVFYQPSIGAVIVDRAGYPINQLLHWADIAMYKAKHSGGTLTWYLFDPEQDDDTEAQRAQMALVALIRKALDEDLFELVAQPIAHIQRSEVNRYEILLRLQDEQGQYVSPAQFIPVAEHHGLIFEVDYWVLDHAFKALAQLPEEIRFSVNISAPSMQRPDLTNVVRMLIQRHGVAPCRIVVELTETAYVENLSQVKANLQGLKQLGVQLAVDDFGVGFTSFSYLTELNFDYVKIDGLYIKDLPENKIHQEFVGGLCEIVHAFGMQVVGEFVEDDEIIHWLKKLQVDYAQGWHIGKPQAVTALLQQYSEETSESA